MVFGGDAHLKIDVFHSEVPWTFALILRNASSKAFVESHFLFPGALQIFAANPVNLVTPELNYISNESQMEERISIN